MRDAHAYLQASGHINFGAVEEPAPPAAAGAAAAADADAGAAKDGAAAGEPPGPAGEGDGKADGHEAGQPAEPDERAVVFKLYEVLRAADMGVTTEKMVRAQLADAFGGALDVAKWKGTVKKHVSGSVGRGAARGARRAPSGLHSSGRLWRALQRDGLLQGASAAAPQPNASRWESARPT